MFRRGLLIQTLCLAVLLAVSVGAQTRRNPGWSLAWADEFNGPAGTAPDPAKWGYDTGGWGWGNNELQTYTSRIDNAFINGEGHLVIKTLKETFTGADNITRNYTSARLLTKGKFEQKYGRFEARIRLPFGQGIWPAFWMLGNDIDQPGIGWPQCGEIDIMENRGSEPAVNHGSLHGPGYSGGQPLTATWILPGQGRFSDDFHVFAIEWEPEVVRFYVDGALYQKRTPEDLPPGRKWVFDHPFFMLLNVAVGGNFGGNPDGTTVWPQTMLVDYVRVYERRYRRVAEELPGKAPRHPRAAR
ncbi:MAG TPA: glycoside hydrolase family 16 protein [Blastocatellia bacterium]|nr:glycoside hydrolase family 16 protein [Blastocatellia bacterium]